MFTWCGASEFSGERHFYKFSKFFTDVSATTTRDSVVVRLQIEMYFVAKWPIVHDSHANQSLNNILMSVIKTIFYDTQFY